MEQKNRYIFDITNKDLNHNFPDQPKFRLNQIHSWLYEKLIFSPHSMKNIPLNLRENLSYFFIFEYPKIIKTEVTGDKTEKFLLELHDKEQIEFVLIFAPDRTTLCLSSQVGCPVKCKFCASGKYGLVRNLTPAEIIAQLLLAAKEIGKYPDNIVFMGIGEPLLNFNNLIKGLEIICFNKFIDFSQRKITISTSGIPENILRLAQINKQWNLAVSLHATTDDIRSKLIPENNRYKLNKILEACKEYIKITGRQITLEYTLIDKINNKKQHAFELAKLAKDLRAKINIIPYNTTYEDFERPDNNSCLSFYNYIKDIYPNVTLRLEKGSKINAACGQLRIS